MTLPTPSGPQGLFPPAEPLFDPTHELLSLALSSALGAAPGPMTARWLAECAGWTGVLPEPRAIDLDVLLDKVWRKRGRVGRRALGQVFTPRDVARQLLLETPGADEGGLLDPACGGGVFLVEAVAVRAARSGGTFDSAAARQVLSDIQGLDLDPDVCRLARLMVGLAVVSHLRDAERVVSDLPMPAVTCIDATDPAVIDRFAGRIRTVVGNPPYREAKGMPAAERDWLRGRFALEGAFDLYMAFVLLALDIVGRDGAVGYVLPNKFLVARYANRLRERLLSGGNVHAVVDLSELDVFGKVGVYPILLVLGPSVPHIRTVFAVRTADGLGGRKLDAVLVETESVRRLVEPPVLWTAPRGPLANLLQRLPRFAPLVEWVEARSTCSFHETGLRERYIRPQEELPDGLPYLGGRSFNRRNEVRPFALEWQGYRIRYAVDELKAAGNPLPPLSRFEKPKVIFCQHARSGVAWFDARGEYVTKDVYPIAVARSGRADETAVIAALMNSRVFSVIYAIVYRGVAVGSGYLHLLPAFLHALPTPRCPEEWMESLAADVIALQAEPNREGFERIDNRISAMYELTDAEHDAVHAFADTRLRFSPDPFDR